MFDGAGSPDQVFPEWWKVCWSIEFNKQIITLVEEFSNPKSDGWCNIRFIPAGTSYLYTLNKWSFWYWKAGIHLDRSISRVGSNATFLPCGLKEGTTWENWDIFHYWQPSVLSLVACAPKRYERKHSPVGTSSIKKSSGQGPKRAVARSEVRWTGQRSHWDLVKSRPSGHLFDHWKQCVFDLFASGTTDSLAGVEQWSRCGWWLPTRHVHWLLQNTYTPGTYNLQDVIDKLNAEETSDSIRSLSQDQLIQLTNEKKNGWIYSTKTRALLRNCTLVVVVE